MGLQSDFNYRVDLTEFSGKKTMSTATQRKPLEKNLCDGQNHQTF